MYGTTVKKVYELYTLAGIVFTELDISLTVHHELIYINYQLDALIIIYS